ncbi:Peptidase C15, pyroglutamyl peptidase I family and Peptidase C15, pyroglutamyl peptidase I-like family-containing protein [Strongyloides ratti]|uniref:Peptidase C15, pyroglutamyl peptidase I family and Peptidase C15, pyroglutamyl peptidase I-like family-containing protein n=1 Tax=Strongyloides ratti TaxID=34506 RepID=A0A090L4V0_STRRB|nr:Peptidase C15, pyroglutamyl peptidase I family and Peptidase C15, pyroglutamyl peptidase I-like family-containing protein [Strongyloides ratti]CEF63142.1 Peptidase C15, pyroglutamyl peptidase I family and Peptidase C15, pyroglutamyl peptidase I-like family-containing protein [Strongyloides ratti]
MSNSKPTLLLTGYGPFNHITENPSKAIVTELYKEFEDNKQNFPYNLEIKILPVSYKSVHDEMKQYYQREDIDYFIHLGVDSTSKYIIFETEAESHGYFSEDIDGCVPEDNCCIVQKGGEPQTLKSSFPLHKICSEMNETNDYYPIMLSTDPGKFLCSYIYYQTLYHSPKTLFIHVPNVKLNDDAHFNDILCTIKKAIDNVVIYEEKGKHLKKI